MTRLLMTALLALPLAEPAGMPWRETYAKGQAEAAKSGKLMLVVVGSPNCKWCVHQDRTTFRDAGVINVAESVIPVKVDGNAEAALRMKLGVRAYPTTLVIDAKGKILERFEGYASPAQMIALMKTK